MDIEIWKENLRRNQEAHPDWSPLRLVESTPQAGAFSGATGSALTSIRIALRCLEEIEPTAMLSKRRKIRNFNEQAERESQLSAARIALDHAITLLEPNGAAQTRRT